MEIIILSNGIILKFKNHKYTTHLVLSMALRDLFNGDCHCLMMTVIIIWEYNTVLIKNIA